MVDVENFITYLWNFHEEKVKVKALMTMGN